LTTGESLRTIHRIHKWRLSWGEQAIKRENEALCDTNYSDWINMSVFLFQDDIPDSSLAGRDPAGLKAEE